MFIEFRTTFIVLFALILAACGKTETPLQSKSGTISQQAVAPKEAATPNFQKDELYPSVQKKMLDAGWKPYRAPDAEACTVSEKKCADRPELEACGNNGRCVYTWRDGNRIARIVTAIDIAEDDTFEGVSTEFTKDETTRNVSAAEPKVEKPSVGVVGSNENSAATKPEAETKTETAQKSTTLDSDGQCLGSVMKSMQQGLDIKRLGDKTIGRAQKLNDRMNSVVHKIDSAIRSCSQKNQGATIAEQNINFNACIQNSFQNKEEGLFAIGFVKGASKVAGKSQDEALFSASLLCM